VERTYLVRGREVRVRQFDDVVAVRAPAASAALSAYEASPAVQALPEHDRKAFQRSGWFFVPTSAASVRTGADVRPVFLSRGHLLVDGRRLTVKWDDQCPEDEAKSLIEDAGLTVAARLPFGTNLFEVEVPPGRDSIEAASQLCTRPGCRFAEPVLLQDLSGR
jgi:hypothetical protein